MLDTPDVCKTRYNPLKDLPAPVKCAVRAAVCRYHWCHLINGILRLHNPRPVPKPSITGISPIHNLTLHGSNNPPVRILNNFFVMRFHLHPSLT